MKKSFSYIYMKIHEEGDWKMSDSGVTKWNMDGWQAKISTITHSIWCIL